MTDTSKLEAEFEEDLRQFLENEKKYGLNSSRIQQMLEQYGGVTTAHRLLDPTRTFPKDTFGYIRRIERPDLSVEYYVCQEKYKPLFSDAERQIAAFRLKFED